MSLHTYPFTVFILLLLLKQTLVRGVKGGGHTFISLDKLNTHWIHVTSHTS